MKGTAVSPAKIASTFSLSKLSSFGMIFRCVRKTVVGLTVTNMYEKLVLVGTPLGIIMGSIAGFGDSLYGNTQGASLVSRLFSKLIRSVVIIYIDVIRAIPLLLLILIAYYGMPIVAQIPFVGWIFSIFGYDSPIEISAFQTSVIALSINLSAFLADLVRGAVAGIPQGLIFAGRSLAMSRWLVWRRIVLPEVIREIIPSVTLLYITIFKMSTICSVVAVQEVLHASETLIQKTYKPLEFYFAVCVIFVIIIVPLSMLARRLESTNLFRRRSV